MHLVYFEIQYVEDLGMNLCFACGEWKMLSATAHIRNEIRTDINEALVDLVMVSSLCVLTYNHSKK